MERRIIGMDLGVRSAHVAVVIDEAGAVLARRRCRPVRSSFEALEALALKGAGDDVHLEVVVEPTGVSWLPVAGLLRPPGPRRLQGQLGQGPYHAQVIGPPCQVQWHRRYEPGADRDLRPRAPGPT
jgi:hypothetical protein